jgi:RNA recognition motif-containing protein
MAQSRNGWDVKPPGQADCERIKDRGMGVMNNKLFVGNISFKMNEEDLKDLFSSSGKVVSVAIPTDRETGRKRGFAFVEMENQEDAQAAIDSFNGKTIEGREIVVNASRPKERTNVTRQ